MYPGKITDFSKRALDWPEGVQITSVKEASQIAKALCLWEGDARKAIEWLQHTRLADYWESGNSVQDTATTYDSGTYAVPTLWPGRGGVWCTCMLSEW